MLGLAQTFEEPGLPQPRRLVLISPWLDLTLSNPDLPAVEARDPWLSIAGTREAGTAWADGDDPTDPQLSPLNGPLDEPLDGLPPINVYVGTRELCYPDVLHLQERGVTDGVKLQATVCDGAVRVYPLVPAPEGRAAARTIVQEASQETARMRRSSTAVPTSARSPHSTGR